jgi:phage head maturation protease
MIRHRTINFELRGIDEEKRQATFVASTERAVPMGSEREVLRASGVRLERYSKNPILLDSHDRSSLDCVIGRADVKIDGLRILATTTYADTDRAETAWRLVKGGFVRGMSIGYAINPDKVRKLRKGESDGEGDSKVEGPASIVNEWELLEISNVPVPADEDAVRRALNGNKSERTKRMSGINYAKLVAAVATRDADMGDDMDKDAREDGGKDDAEAGEKVSEKGAEITCPHCGKAFPMPEREADGDQKPDGTKPGLDEGKKEHKKAMELIPEERAARVLEAQRRSALAITPKGLEHVAERALAEGLSLEQIRAKLVEAQAARFKPVGTTEPAPIEPAAKRDAELPKEITDDVLVRSILNLSD